MIQKISKKKSQPVANESVNTSGSLSLNGRDELGGIDPNELFTSGIN